MTRRRKILLAVLAALVLGGGAFLWALPEIVRRVALDQIPKVLGRAAAIEDIDLNLFTGRVAIKKFRLAEREGPDAFVEFERLDLRLALAGLFSSDIRVTDMRLVSPGVRLVRLGADKFNFSDILERLAAGAQKDKPPSRWTVSLGRLALERGQIAIEDRAVSPAADWSMRNLGFEAAGVTTRAEAEPGRVTLTANLGPARIDLKIERVRVQPVQATAHLALTGFDLKRILVYVPQGLPASLDAGMLALAVTGTVETEHGKVKVLTGSGTLTVEGLALTQPGRPAPFMTAPRLAVDIKSADILARDVTVASIELEGMDLAAVRDREGRIDLLVPIQAAPSAEAAPPPVPAPAAPGSASATAEVTVPAPAPMRVKLERLSIKSSRIAFKDEAVSPARQWSLERLEVSGAGLSTGAEDPPGTLQLRTQIVAAPGGGKPATLAVDASALRLTPIGASAKVQLGGLDLAWVAPYVPPTTGAAVSRGMLALTADTRYERDDAGRGRATVSADMRLTGLEAANGAPAVSVGLSSMALTLKATAEQGDKGLTRAVASGAVKLGDVAVSRPGEARPFVTVPSLAVALKQLDLVGRAIELASVELDGLGLTAVRDAEGRIDLLALAASPPPQPGPPAAAAAAAPPSPAPPAAPPARPPAPPAPWKLSLDRLKLDKGTATFEDRGTTPLTTLPLTDLSIVVERLTWPQKTPGTLVLGTNMPGGGRTEVKGTFQLDPLKLQVTSSTVDAPIEPYVAYFPFAARFGGLFSGDSVNEVEMQDGKLQAASRGTARARDITVSAPGVSEPVIKLSTFEIRGIDFSWPNYALIERVTLSKPVARLERDPDGVINLRALFEVKGPEVKGPKETPADKPAEKPAAAPPAEKPPAAEKGPPAAEASTGEPKPGLMQTMVLDFQEIAIEDGYFRFLDRTTTPAFSEDLSQLNLSIRDLSNVMGRKRTTLTAKGVVGGDATLDLRGEVSGLGETLKADLVGEIKDFALTAANPYADSMVSWVITQGKLTGKVHYHIEGSQLTAEHDLKLGGLKVEKSSREGDETKKRLGVPLGLVVALLKDSRGDIDFNLPLGGNVQERTFDWGEMIWAGVKQVIGKVLLAPFRAIGRLFTGGGDEKEAPLAVNPVKFAPGAAAISPEMEMHLTRVADFVRRAPAIKLDLEPVITAPDVDALKNRAVMARIEAFAKTRDIKDGAVAIGAYYATQRMPGPTPKAPEEQLAALRRKEPAPDEAALRDLADRRLKVTRERLATAEGVPLTRLKDGAPKLQVDKAEEGRLEFGIVAE